MGLWDEFKDGFKESCKNLFTFAEHEREVANCRTQLAKSKADLDLVDAALRRLEPQLPPLRSATLKVDFAPFATSTAVLLIGLWGPLGVAGRNEVHWLAIAGLLLFATATACVLLCSSIRRRMRWISLRPRLKFTLAVSFTSVALALWTLTPAAGTRYLLAFAWFSMACIGAAIALRVVPQVHCVSERGLAQAHALRATRSSLRENIGELQRFIDGPPSMGIEKAVVALAPIALAAVFRTGAINLDVGGLFDGSSPDAAGGDFGGGFASGDPSQLIDLNADGIADVSGAGTAVIPIESYVRSTGLVRSHYRTLPDGILWNNLRRS